MDVTIALLLVSISILAASGLAGLLLGFRSVSGQRIATALMLAGSALGLFAAGRVLIEGGSQSLDRAWLLPWGSFRLKADGLSSFFLIPVFLVPALASVYGLGYWSPADRPGSARALQFFTGLLAASMTVVVLAE